MSVLAAVTAAGGGVGQSIIKALSGTVYETVAIDPSDKAAGLYMADMGYLGVPLTDDRFIEHLISICHGAGAKYLFPGFDAELSVLSSNSNKILSEGIIPIVSDATVIALSDDKYKLFKFLKEHDMPHIPTSLGTEKFRTENKQGPFLVKPVVGCRSQGVERFETLDEVEDYLKDNPEEDLIVQEYIEGEEYTCGTVSFGGCVEGVICMTRELRSGDTYKARVDQNPEVIKFVTSLIGEIKPFGPCNVQLIVRDSIPYVLEINARCSGTTAARALAGFNEPKIVLDFLEQRPIRYSIEDHLQILRFWQELPVRPEDKEMIRS
jgi:carbamoyl-phosphate synthase large subunit